MSASPRSKLTFTPTQSTQPGTITSILVECYAELLSIEPAIWQNEKQAWQAFDMEVYSHLDTIGRCVFFTCLDGELIGFSSYDPRPCPAWGVIGHNAVRPRFRGRGAGRLQILETLERLQRMGAAKARVTTSAHPFFVPAQRMYLSCGFIETGRAAGGPDPRYPIIEYEIAIDSTQNLLKDGPLTPTRK